MPGLLWKIILFAGPVRAMAHQYPTHSKIKSFSFIRVKAQRLA